MNILTAMYIIIQYHTYQEFSISPSAAASVLCVFRRAKDHRNLLHYSPCLKNTCVRQVALDKWFPLSAAGSCREAWSRRCLETRSAP